MNVIGTLNQSTTTSFKTPLVPHRKGKKKIKSRSEINHNPSFETFLKNLNGKINQSTKKLNKRKTFKCTPFTSENLVITPAVDMINKISKRSREEEVDQDEVFNQPKRRKLETMPRRNFRNENFICVDETKISCEEMFRIFGMKDTDVRDRKIHIKNENLLQPSEESKVDELPEPLSVLDGDKVPSTFLNSSDDKLNLLMEFPTLDIKIEEKFDVPDYESHTVLQADKLDSSNTLDLSDTFDSSIKSTKVPVIDIYAGQIVWSRSTKFPYWPSIVCPSETGVIQDNQRVHVRFCANKGSSGWVHMKNVFEFNGIESFLKRKQSTQSNMRTKPEKNEFQLAFNVKKYKAWPKSVVEGMFILEKPLEVRHAFFDIMFMLSACESSKSLQLSEIISELSTSPFNTAENIFNDNPKICEEIKDELNRFTANLDFEDLGISVFKQPVASPTQSIKRKSERRESVPAFLPSHSERIRRKSLRALSATSQNLSTSALDVSVEQQIVTKDQGLLKEQKINEKFKRQVEKLVEFEKDLTSYVMKSYPKNKLFEGVRRGNACKICLSDERKCNGELVKCSGTCGDYIHTVCVSNPIDGESKSPGQKLKKRKSDFRITTLTFCSECRDPLAPAICYACKAPSSLQSSLVRCRVKSCGRYYHIKCLSHWLQTKYIETDKIICPAHVCHTCVSDDPQNKHYSTASSNLTRCVKCPTTFHIDSRCIPAGSKILTQSQHVCIRHRLEVRKPANVSWCYICGGAGGVLLCCESCPQASHQLCLKLPAAPDRYFCDSCETGRHPLYGETVWAKLPTHRWWPAIVVPPFCIPDFLENIPHREHDLCVRFFGSYEYAWIGRSFVYLFEKDDSNSLSGDSKQDKALMQAENWFNKFTLNNIDKDNKIINSDKDELEPKPYGKIATIKPLPPARLIKGESESQRCNCNPDDFDPCGPTSNCTNRACLTECDADICPCGENCKNQGIQRRVYAKFKRVYMGDKGFGLLAEQFISAGTLIIEYVGELVTELEFQRRRSAKQSHNFYFMQYMKGLYIDAELKGNMSRFINHSCNPNCEPQVWSVNGVNRIGLFALLNIPKGTELTFNYEFDDDTHKCFCGESCCKGFIGKKSS